MNRPCYNNLLQFMQSHNFRNLNRVILTHWKQLNFELMPFDIVFQELINITFSIWWNWFPFQETRALLKDCNCLIGRRYQRWVIPFLVFWGELRRIRWCLSCIAGQSSFRWNVTLSWLDCWLFNRRNFREINVCNFANFGPFYEILYHKIFENGDLR